MLNQKVLLSGVDYFSLDNPINPYYSDTKVDPDQIKKEHDLLNQTFEDVGIEVIKVPPPKGAPDGVYTANWALIRENRAVMASLPNARKIEEKYAREVLGDMGIECIDIPQGLKFSGQGDALPLHTEHGDFLLAGQGYRSDSQAQEFAAKELGFELVQLRTLPLLDESGKPAINKVTSWQDSLFYDIDLAIAVIAPDLIAYCPSAFDDASLTKIANLPTQKIEVTYREATQGFACNLVSTGKTVIMSAAAPLLQSEIEARGFEVVTPEIKELRKGGGFIRCVVLSI